MQFSFLKELITGNSNIKSAKTCTEENFSARVCCDINKSFLILFYLNSTSVANVGCTLITLHLELHFPTFLKLKVKPIV